MQISVDKKLFNFVVILLLVLALIIVYSAIKNNWSNSTLKEPTGYTQGIPDSVVSNPDILVVKNKSAADGIPYFSEKISQIPNLRWQLRFFQPVLKAITVKNEGVYLETEYLDLNGKPKTVLVFVGGKLNGNDTPFIYTVKDGRVLKFTDLEHLKNNLVLNQRLNIEYLQTADNPQAAKNTEICLRYNDRVCHVSEYVNQHQNEFLEFYQTGELSDDLFLVGLSIKENLNEK